MQTVLSEMFDNLLNSPLQPLSFTEGGYFGKCDLCQEIKSLFKINSVLLICKNCNENLEKDISNHDYPSISQELKEQIVNKVIEKTLIRINDKQQCVDLILHHIEELKNLIKVSNKIIDKIKNSP